MKNKITPLVSAIMALCLAASCGDSEVKAGDLVSGAKDALGNLDSLDVSKLSPEALKEKLGGAASEITKKLGEIKDKASAEQVVKAVEPMLDKLKSFKTTLGDKMPDLASLKTAADNLMQKFSGDQGIMEVIKPMLDKLKSLVG